ncbi:hypothetical protein COW36_05975 [bacterium (Candidatus Blackallbacteria) CG17_big_fil_post_rev_8_21_14_2_50_48_46]|uniref:Imm-5-like domain-containing protein n=1 Tax=bacterium (Candidatus Blackallbacteria) CG17_big_fil_post_rev_8_21_14_2_50_48_46 TaxID=2014261 RepID=A0A2M7G8A8_9BACT|nr:MAG: hypothetical protein COW64_21570 [bacterium (Candidatus Blackallbacteria) CG18_big_fil_WC_8_21_14_2_50_49_26]PIW18314.1 MAG: hypothetical protein COW36_05975 [bacterium (Candidatus Blackallbacteria) CG17_big_fil_post_rev_8_21_14_2_50_48_46]PIW49538.1 MAG: hypothetical protein COW20_05790 [bacterium (Candidatus Blackallbacteria) CG13_big_fil_rev_8_21_14_2_50_49_14]
MVEHLLPYGSQPCDARIETALLTLQAWVQGTQGVSEARKASVAAHAAAREALEAKDKWIARAAGHAVATAHMADHAPGAAYYALKALQVLNLDQASIQAEFDWQKSQLPIEIRFLVESTFKTKFARLNLKYPPNKEASSHLLQR